VNAKSLGLGLIIYKILLS